MEAKIPPICHVAKQPNWWTAFLKLTSRCDFPERWRNYALAVTKDWTGDESQATRRNLVGDLIYGDLGVDDDVRTRFQDALHLLAWHPGDKKSTVSLALALSRAARESGLTERVATAVRGWKVFASGKWPDANDDPISAAQKVGADNVTDCAESELICDAFPILSNWRLVDDYIVGEVSGHSHIADGTVVTTSSIAEFAPHQGWVMTQNNIYLLGDRAKETRSEEKPGVVVMPEVIAAPLAKSAAQAELMQFAGKKIPLYPTPDVTKVRAQLVREFPHAENVIDIVLRDLVGAPNFRLKPTILVGSPGCGKSRLVRRIAELCGVHCSRFDGAGSDDSSFAGTPRRWATGEACFPLSVIRLCGNANPLLLVDEIDKAGHTRNGSLQNAILAFMETETAKRYPDPYAQSEVDLSFVSFFLTANDTTCLPAPLKDRCRVLRMPPIRPEHVQAIVPAIVSDLAAERGVDVRWIEPFAADEIEMVKRLLGDGSIRRLRMIVEKVIDGREEMAMRN